jgi:hypothetical protein
MFKTMQPDLYLLHVIFQFFHPPVFYHQLSVGYDSDNVFPATSWLLAWMGRVEGALRMRSTRGDDTE